VQRVCFIVHSAKVRTGVVLVVAGEDHVCG
jgi:hypothetical protein